jgi:hypothetical protein
MMKLKSKINYEDTAVANVRNLDLLLNCTFKVNCCIANKLFLKKYDFLTYTAVIVSHRNKNMT